MAKDFGDMIGGLFTAFALADAKRKNKEQDFQDAIKLKRASAKIEQEFQSPLSKLVDVAKASKALSDVGIDPRGIFGDVDSTVSPLDRAIEMGTGGVPRATGQADVTQPTVSPLQEAGGGLQLEPTKFQPTAFGGIQPTEFGVKGAKQKEKILGKAIDVSGKQLEALIKSDQNLIRLKGAASNLIAKGKLAVSQMGGFGAKQFIKGKFGELKAKTGLFDLPLEDQFSGLAEFKGQLVEMTLALSPILTGQNRVIRGIVQMLAKTLPKFPTSEAQFAGQLRQTLENGFRLSIGLNQGIVSLEDLESILRAKGDEGVRIFNDLLGRVKFDSTAQSTFNDFWTEVRDTPASKPTGLGAGGGRFLQKGPTREQAIAEQKRRREQ